MSRLSCAHCGRGVFGLIASPIFTSLPKRVRSSAKLDRSRTSAWKERMSEPASMNLGAYFRGSLSMRCVSKGRSLTLRSALTVPGPKVMLGAKCPSMTSRWTWSAPPWSASLTASAR